MRFKPEPGHVAAVAGGLSAVGLATAVVLSSVASADTESEACTPSRISVMAADGSTVDVHTCVYPADSELPEPSEPSRTTEPPADPIPPEPPPPKTEPYPPPPSNEEPPEAEPDPLPPSNEEPPGGGS